MSQILQRSNLPFVNAIGEPHSLLIYHTWQRFLRFQDFEELHGQLLVHQTLLIHFYAMVCPLNLGQNRLGTQFHISDKIREDLFREDMDGIRSGERLVYTFSRDYILLQLDVLTMMIIENISWAVHVKNNYYKPVEVRKSNRFAKTFVNKFFHCIPCIKIMTVHVSAVISFIRDTRTRQKPLQ